MMASEGMSTVCAGARQGKADSSRIRIHRTQREARWGKSPTYPATHKDTAQLVDIILPLNLFKGSILRIIRILSY